VRALSMHERARTLIAHKTYIAHGTCHDPWKVPSKFGEDVEMWKRIARQTDTHTHTHRNSPIYGKIVRYYIPLYTNYKKQSYCGDIHQHYKVVYCTPLYKCR
jgi:hypothetical protein